MPERHDSGNRLLFFHPRMVEDLLRGFVWPGGRGEVPQSGYLLIDVLRASLPVDGDNLVSLLFELERSQSPEALARPIRRLRRSSRGRTELT